MQRPLRILLVDDSPHFLEATRDFLRYQASLEVVGVAMEGNDALAQSQKLKPDIILLDLSLANSSGLDLIPVLKQNLPQSRVIVLTMMEESSYRAAALQAGADGFVHKSHITKTLLSVLYEGVGQNDTESAVRDRITPAMAQDLPFHKLLEHLPDLIYRYEFAPQRGFSYVSPAATHMTGYTPEEHYADPDLASKLVHPDDRHLLDKSRQGEVNESQPLTLRWIRKDGKVIWTEQQIVAIHNENGELVAIEGVARDITQRKGFEQEHDRLFNYSLDLLCIAAFDGYFKQLNPAWEKLLGWTIQELMAKPYMELIHPEDREPTLKAAAALIQGKYVYQFENRFLCKDGSYKWISWNSQSVPGESLIFAVARDMTEQKEIAAQARCQAIAAEGKLRESNADLEKRVAERTLELRQANIEMERALRVKDEFLANMSHELRTPLNAILGLSESLAEQMVGTLNDKQQKYVHIISESGHHLLSLINDILDLAKIEAGQIVLNRTQANIKVICESSLRLVRQLAKKKNQEIRFDMAPGLDLICADERRLKQMLVNLLGNAVKFTPAAGKIGLEVHEGPAANQVRFTVWDTGIGIKDEDMARLFQPFVQLDSNLAREATGTGLGLALVAQMARLHGGSVNASSQMGAGSRFTIILPCDPGLAADPSLKVTSTGRLQSAGPGDVSVQTILVVEDTETTRTL